jgi:hypothetical protein
MQQLLRCLSWRVRIGVHSRMTALTNESIDNPLFNAGKGAVFNTAGKVAPSLDLCFILA